jgi:DNA-binding NarL/FixJ family response regulator
MMRVILADDHMMFRRGLRALLEKEDIEVVGEAADGFQAVTLACNLNPDIAILDISMPHMNGIETTREIHKLRPEIKVIILTMFEDDTSVYEAFRADVRGYVLKTQAPADLIQALKELQLGRQYISPSIARNVVEDYLRRAEEYPDNQLTSKERQVLQLVAEGNATKQIAKLLNLTAKTVESHRYRLMKKLGSSNIAGMVRHAVRLGLVTP